MKIVHQGEIANYQDTWTNRCRASIVSAWLVQFSTNADSLCLPVPTAFRDIKEASETSRFFRVREKTLAPLLILVRYAAMGPLNSCLTLYQVKPQSASK